MSKAYVHGYASREAVRDAGVSTVVLLPTLHQFHSAARNYGFGVLRQIIEGLRPDILAVELTEADVLGRQPQRYKMEYQKCVYPYLDQHDIPVVALEPVEPPFSEWVKQLEDAENALKESSPQRYEEFQNYALDLFSQLLQSWDSPAAVDSDRTDRMLEEKHARQGRLFGSRYQDAWDRRNEYIAQSIGETANANPGKRIVALVGVEHNYWLRPWLAEMARSSSKWSLAPRMSQAVPEAKSTS